MTLLMWQTNSAEALGKVSPCLNVVDSACAKWNLVVWLMTVMCVRVCAYY